MSPHLRSASRSSGESAPPVLGAALVDPAVRLSRGHPVGGHQEQGRGGRERWEAEHPLSVAPGEREPRLAQEERHIASEAGGKLEELVPGDGVRRQPIGQDQRGRRIARPATESCLHRNALLERQVHGKLPAGGVQHHLRRPHRQVVRRRPDVRSPHLDAHGVARPLARLSARRGGPAGRRESRSRGILSTPWRGRAGRGSPWRGPAA